MEDYDFVIEHRPGTQHLNADALSRIPSCEQCDLKHVDPKRKRNVKYESVNQLVRQTEFLRQDDDRNTSTVMKLMKQKRLSEESPSELTQLDESGHKLWRMRRKLRIRGDLLYKFSDKRGIYQLIVPDSDRKSILHAVHSMAHVGIERTIYLLKELYYWPAMEMDVKHHVSACSWCQQDNNTSEQHIESLFQLYQMLQGIHFRLLQSTSRAHFHLVDLASDTFWV